MHESTTLAKQLHILAAAHNHNLTSENRSMPVANPSRRSFCSRCCWLNFGSSAGSLYWVPNFSALCSRNT